MKDFTLLFLFSFLYTGLIGQTEPIQKVEFEPDPIMMDAYDFATGKMNDVKWMAKASLGLVRRIGFEYKLSNSISANVETSFGGILSLIGTNNLSLNNTAGLRYYIGHQKQITAGEIGNNLNGKYVEFGTPLRLGLSLNVYQNAFLGIGMQSRFLKYGMVDTRARLQYTGADNTLRFSTGFNIGLAFSKDYNLVEMEENRCAIVRCYDEQFYMLKIPLSRLFNFEISQSQLNLDLNPSVELEHRLTRVSLTVNHEVRSNYNLLNSTVDTIGSYDYLEASYRLGIRWYVGKKKRIIKGKTSNNLSGFYMGPIGEYGMARARSENYSVRSALFYSAGFQYGYQTRLLKNLYFNVNLGLMGREYHELLISQTRLLLDIKRNSFEIDSGLRIIEIIPNLGVMVGYAF